MIRASLFTSEIRVITLARIRVDDTIVLSSSSSNSGALSILRTPVLAPQSKVDETLHVHHRTILTGELEKAVADNDGLYLLKVVAPMLNLQRLQRRDRLQHP